MLIQELMLKIFLKTIIKLLNTKYFIRSPATYISFRETKNHSLRTNILIYSVNNYFAKNNSLSLYTQQIQKNEVLFAYSFSTHHFLPSKITIQNVLGSTVKFPYSLTAEPWLTRASVLLWPSQHAPPSTRSQHHSFQIKTPPEYSKVHFYF